MTEAGNRPPDNKNETIFYYSRERRLERASPEVQSLNDGNYVRPTLGKVLFGTRGNVIMFLSFVVICVFGVAISFFTRETPPGSAMTIGRNSLTVVILRVDEVLILGITKNAPESGEFYTGEVDIAVSPAVPRASGGEIPEETQVFSHRVLFRPTVIETFYISLPFEGDDFILVLRAGDEQRSIRLRVTDAD